MSRLTLALALIWALNAPSAIAQRMDAASLDEAVGMVEVAASNVEYFRNLCSEKFPDSRAVIDRAALIWFDNNADELTASRKRIDEKGRAEFQSMFEPLFAQANEALRKLAEEKGLDLVCGSFAQKWQDGSGDFTKDKSNASKLLLTYLEAHPLSDEARKRADHQMGCVKTLVNKDTDLAVAREGCACVTEVHWTRLTVEERAEFDRLAQDGKPVAEYGPFKRIVPVLSTCFQPRVK